MKKCKKCSSYKIKKNWKRLGKQRFLCNDCGYLWEHGSNTKKTKLDSNKLLHDTVINNKIYRQLADENWTNIQSIQKSLDSNDFEKNLTTK